MTTPDGDTGEIERQRLPLLAILALAAGALAGGICAVFRLALSEGGQLRAAAVVWAQDSVLYASVYVICVAAAAFLAAWLVERFAPEASGSGIPHVEAVLAKKLPAASPRFIPIKFIGGWLAMSGGLALGREGPSVQMAAGISALLSRLANLRPAETYTLIAGGAGAGLATAFNAPAAGAIFVLEELMGRFDRYVAVVALGCSVSAIAISRAILGNHMDLSIGVLPSGGVAAAPLYLLLGTVVGLLAAFYNRFLLVLLTVMEKIPVSVSLRAALIGAIAGAVSLFLPDWTGGGESLTQAALNGTLAIWILPGLFVFRLIFGALSYAAATPGGLFAPMLVLGAVAGLGLGHIYALLLPEVVTDPEVFALLGMAAIFAGVVRAPLTGIVLVIEMTGASTLLLPLLTSSFAALFVVERLGIDPIYASLGRRAAKPVR